MERRELLNQVGVAAGAGAAGITGIITYDGIDDDGGMALGEQGDPRDEPRQEIPARYTEEFERIVHADAAGADPSGEEPIDDFIAEYAADDTLVTFGPGTYRLGPVVLSGLSKFGMVGLGEERPTFETANSTCHPADAHLSFEGVEEFILEDVDFEQNGSGGAIHLFAQGDVGVRNVKLTGHCPEQIASMRVDIRDPDAEAIVENLVTRDDHRDSQLTGLYVGRSHAGSITFKDCEIRGFSDNGLYASSPGHEGGENGTVEVIGGTFADNNIANVRLGTTGSVARGVTVDVSAPPSLGGAVNARGIRLRERGDHVIDDCEITIAADTPASLGAIVFHPDAGGAEIRNSSIHIDADSVRGINALQPSDDGVPGPILENVSITGRAASGYAATLDGRNGTVFRNCTIEQNGHDRGGIRLANARDCQIVDSQITTTGEPVRLERASASVENTTIATPDGRRTIDSLEAHDEVLTP